MFELAAPRSAAVDNSSELTRSLELDEEVMILKRILYIVQCLALGGDS